MSSPADSSDPTPAPNAERWLVLGATGYVGSHLVPFLAAHGKRVRAAGRRVEALEAHDWPGVETVGADALEPDSLDRALQGVSVAFYLVHSMAAGPEFPKLDRQAAIHFRDAAARAGVRRIVYLGGLLPGGHASTHLNSRGETGELLRQGPVPVTEIRAGIIIGPGSAAFEVIRDLVFHLPLMVTPKWVSSRSQPIALEDVMTYLLHLPDLPQAEGRIYDVGGPEVLTYRELMQRFGRLVGRRPVIVPVPVLTPRMSAMWLDLLTSVPGNIARALIEGLEHDVLADDAEIRALIPLALQNFDQAAKAAFDVERAEHSARRWARIRERFEADAVQRELVRSDGAAATRWKPGSMLYRQNRAEFGFYAKQMHGGTVAQAPVDAVWEVISSIGGDNGYYYMDALWQIRGLLDRLTGGTGMTRGRRDPKDVAIGDAVDFWRVVGVEPQRRLTLLAEMLLPGSAALEFRCQPLERDRTRVDITATFHPAGFKGLVYWHAMAPPHAFIFPGLAKAIATRAEALAAGRPPA